MTCVTSGESNSAAWPEPQPLCSPCALSLQEARKERSQLLPELIARAQTVSGITRHTRKGVLTGLRLSFHHRNGLMATLVRLADAEHAACTRLRIGFSLQPNGGAINVEMLGPEGTKEMLLALGGSN